MKFGRMAVPPSRVSPSLTPKRTPTSLTDPSSLVPSVGGGLGTGGILNGIWDDLINKDRDEPEAEGAGGGSSIADKIKKMMKNFSISF